MGYWSQMSLQLYIILSKSNLKHLQHQGYIIIKVIFGIIIFSLIKAESQPFYAI
jgi:hypothetical protein